MKIEVGAQVIYDKWGWPIGVKPGTVIRLPDDLKMDPATQAVADALAFKVRQHTTEPHVYEPKRAWWRRMLGR